MPRWARTFVLITGMIVWVGIVAGSLWLKQIPSAVIVGFPAALWIALTGQSTISRKRAQRNETAIEPPTDQEGDPA